MKVSRLIAGASVLVAITSAGSTLHAAPKKQCIASAESGQQLRGTGKLLAARKAFGACTATECPAMVRRDCGRWVDELELTIPSVIVKLEQEDGTELTEGKVEIDGEPSPVAPGGRATQLDPGPHRFVWVREGGNIEQETVIREGERNRTLILRAPLPPRPTTPSDQTSTSGSSSSPLPWILGAVGIVAVGTGGALWGIGLNERSNLSSSCAPTHACLQNDISASRTKLIVGDVLVGVGIVALAGAVYFYLTGDKRSGTATANVSRR